MEALIHRLLYVYGKNVYSECIRWQQDHHGIVGKLYADVFLDECIKSTEKFRIYSFALRRNFKGDKG